MIFLLLLGMGGGNGPFGVLPATEPAAIVQTVGLDPGWSGGAVVPIDFLPLRVRSREAASYRLRENGEICGSGRLVAGENAIRVERPGLLSSNQRVVLWLEVEAPGGIQGQEVVVSVSGIEPEAVDGSLPWRGARTFRLEMRWQGRLLAERARVENPPVHWSWGAKTPMTNRGWFDPVTHRYPDLNRLQLGLGTILRIAKASKSKRIQRELATHQADLRRTRQQVPVARGASQVLVTVELSWRRLPGRSPDADVRQADERSGAGG